MRSISLTAKTVLFVLTFTGSPLLLAADTSVKDLTNAIEAEKFEEALALAKKLTKTQTANEDIEDAIFRAGGFSIAKNSIHRAAEFYRYYLDTFPKGKHAETARAELVGCYNHLRELDLCIEQAKKNLELDPDSKWVEYWTFLIGQSNFKQWKFNEAKPLLEACLKKFPNGDYTSLTKKYLGWIDPDWTVGENGLIDYNGKFKEDIRLKAAIESLPEDIETGFTTLEDRLGVNLRPHTHVMLLFEDSGPKTSPGLKASTYVVGRNNVPNIVMRFFTEFVVSSPISYRQTITHELKHAGFKGAMGQDYENLPEWITEGLAVWGADDVETRMQLVLSNKIAGKKDPLSALDGIEDGDYNHTDYMENALAFDWLESKKVGNVKRFCRELIKGRPYQEIWSEVSGMDYERAMNEADAFCRQKVETAIGDQLVSFIQLRAAQQKAMSQGEAASKKWLADGAREELEQWLEINEVHPAAPMARFTLANALARAGEGEAARNILKHIIEKDSLRCTLRDDAQFWIGVSYNWARDSENAIEAFGVLLRDYPASHSAKQVAGQFRPAGPMK
ncbi:MAG: tol-pal system YbgF family protein [Akkermansiaceae bacterium]